MSKSKEKAAVQEVIPPEETAVATMDSRARAIVGVSAFDGDDDVSMLVEARLRTDPGIPAIARDNWSGKVCRWAAFASENVNEATGEIEAVPTLALMDTHGEVCRLSGWPAISSWAAILKALGQERCLKGVPVRVHRRQSSTVGRSYWVVAIDVAFDLPGNGELPVQWGG